MGREVFLRTNVLRIIEDESIVCLLKELRREFKRCFDTANTFVKQYYEENHRLPSQIEVYWVLRRNNASSTVANEVSKKVLEAWKGYVELMKRGYKVKPPVFKNISVILHNQQYRVYCRKECGR